MSINQSIKTHFYSAICRERIRGCYLWQLRDYILEVSLLINDYWLHWRVHLQYTDCDPVHCACFSTWRHNAGTDLKPVITALLLTEINCMCPFVSWWCQLFIVFALLALPCFERRTDGFVQVVREEDIAEFFEQLQANKRQKTSEAAMQYYCK